MWCIVARTEEQPKPNQTDFAAAGPESHGPWRAYSIRGAPLLMWRAPLHMNLVSCRFISFLFSSRTQAPPKHTQAHTSTPKHTQAHPSTPKHKTSLWCWLRTGWPLPRMPPHAHALPFTTHYLSPRMPLCDDDVGTASRSTGGRSVCSHTR